MDFQLQYGDTVLWANLEQKQQRWQQNQTWIIFYGITPPNKLLFNCSIEVT